MDERRDVQASLADMDRRLREIQYEAELSDRLDRFDASLAPRLRAAFLCHPWVESVERIEVSARMRNHGGLEIAVDDDGPGIPEAQYEEAFKAFGRLDEARNQNAKGVGLGLAIARDVARGHGGDITLSRSPLGGLRAVVRLPA